MIQSYSDLDPSDYNQTNIYAMCRICMKSDKLQSIFKFYDKFNVKHQDLTHKLKICCDIEITMDDNMPLNICEICSEALLLAYDLRILSMKTDSILKEIIKYQLNEDKNTNLDKYLKKQCERKVKRNDYLFDDYNKYNESIEDDLNSIINDDTNYHGENDNSEDKILSNLAKELSQTNHENKTSSEIQEKKFKCYACDLLFTTRRERLIHEDLDCPNIPPGTIYKCKICNATAPDREKFDKHIWIDHRGAMPPDMERNINLSTPKIKGTINNKQPYKNIMCEKCGIRLKTMGNYQKHCLIHEGKQWFQCQQCSFRSTSRHSYNIHIKYQHMGFELLKCDKCSFKTGRKENLKIHQRRHSGERPYHCNLCDYKAINHSNLKRHMPKHTNLRAFECKICGMAYTANRALKCHKMRVHEHKKMFYCKPCCTKYIGEEAYNRHLEKKHK